MDMPIKERGENWLENDVNTGGGKLNESRQTRGIREKKKQGARDREKQRLGKRGKETQCKIEGGNKEI